MHVVVALAADPQPGLLERERARSRQVKKLRAARPFAKWKIDAPTIIVLSTSKKAAAVGSGRAVRRCRLLVGGHPTQPNGGDAARESYVRVNEGYGLIA